MSFNKQMSAADVVATLSDGMTIGIGGWGPRRKPMSLVREILRSDLKDLTLVGYGGMDMGMLCAAGRVKKLIYGFVSLDFVPLEPFFRKAREAGSIEVLELDEGMLHWGLRAAGYRLPFLPIRGGLATAFMQNNPEMKTVQSPYEDGEKLLAMPAIKLDVALLQMHKADQLGNVRLYSPDPFFDEWFARAADKTYINAEEVVPQLESDEADAKANLFERSLVTGVVEARGGAHPCSHVPGYGWDAAHIKRYCQAAAEEGGWQAYADEFLRGSEADYQNAVGGLDAITHMPRQVM